MAVEAKITPAGTGWRRRVVDSRQYIYVRQRRNERDAVVDDGYTASLLRRDALLSASAAILTSQEDKHAASARPSLMMRREQCANTRRVMRASLYDSTTLMIYVVVTRVAAKSGASERQEVMRERYALSAARSLRGVTASERRLYIQRDAVSRCHTITMLRAMLRG